MCAGACCCGAEEPQTFAAYGETTVALLTAYEQDRTRRCPLQTAAQSHNADTCRCLCQSPQLHEGGGHV